MRASRTALAALVAVSLIGCATRGSVKTLDQRVADVEARLSAIDQKATEAERKAAAAEASARAAAERADQAARTAEAIFAKGVSK
jgi:uncharacterized protein (DUF3084 family)